MKKQLLPVLLFSLLVSNTTAQTCTAVFDNTVLFEVVNAFRAAFNAVTGDRGKTEELGRLIDEAKAVLEEKKRLIDACDQFLRSPSDQGWGAVDTRRNNTANALEQFRQHLERHIKTHQADAATPNLRMLDDLIKNKLRTLCGIESKPQTPQQTQAYKRVVDSMIIERNEIQKTVGDLDEIEKNAEHRSDHA